MGRGATWFGSTNYPVVVVVTVGAGGTDAAVMYNECNAIRGWYMTSRYFCCCWYHGWQVAAFTWLERDGLGDLGTFLVVAGCWVAVVVSAPAGHVDGNRDSELLRCWRGWWIRIGR